MADQADDHYLGIHGSVRSLGSRVGLVMVVRLVHHGCVGAGGGHGSGTALVWWLFWLASPLLPQPVMCYLAIENGLLPACLLSSTRFPLTIRSQYIHMYHTQGGGALLHDRPSWRVYWRRSLILVAGLTTLTFTGLSARASTVVSNLDETLALFARIGYNKTSTKIYATAFTNGNTKYILNSVKASFIAKGGNPENFEARLYTDSNGTPGEKDARAPLKK